MSTPSQPTTRAGDAVSPTPAAQSPQGSAPESAEPPVSPPHVAAGSPDKGPVSPLPPPQPPAAKPATTTSVSHDDSHRAAQTERAAQLSDKVPTVVHPAEGASPPRPPKDRPQERTKPKSTKYDFRADDDTAYIIINEMDATGVIASLAIRNLLHLGAAKGKSRPVITPKTPPAPLEAFIGSMGAWLRGLKGVRSRINAPMPHDPKDADLIPKVKAWRETTDDLLAQLPELVNQARSLHELLTGMTPERVTQLRILRIRARKMLENYRAKLALGADEKALKAIPQWEEIVDVINDLGIPEK